MKYDLLIQNGTVVAPAGEFRADIAVTNGKIAALGALGDARADSVLDAQGRKILPGIIDTHVHFRDPGITQKEDFETGSMAAAFGGVTTVFDMPNVLPVTASGTNVAEKAKIAGEKAYVDFGFYGLLVDDNVGEVQPMQDAGVVGYKIYLGTSVGDIAAPTDGNMLAEMREVAKRGMRIGFHAENNALNDWCAAQYKGKTEDAAMLPEIRPDISEADAVANAIRYSEFTGVKIHIYHVSAKRTVDLIRAAKSRGVPITAETCPHYLLFDVGDAPRLGSAMKAFPPIRYPADREALWQGLRDGTIDVIATDHAPHTAEEKQGSIWTVAAGVTGVETAVRLMLDQVNKGALTLQDYVRLASEAPARIWGIYPQKGSLHIGADADITIVDMEKTATIQNEKLHYKNKTGIYEGMRTKGLPVATIVRGSVVMCEGKLTGEKGYGVQVKPGSKL